MITDFKNPLFIDSGAHGLYNEYMVRKEFKAGYSFYETPAFLQYIDEYAAFIKQNKSKIDVFANVDVIFNPMLTWKAQSYLEKTHNITPLPVIHYGTDLKWLKRYLAKGYDYIALGGLGQDATMAMYKNWADQAFDIICDQPSRLPKVKVHGFAVTSFGLMSRYPWYSVDSTSWLKYAAYGMIILPVFHKGKWDYTKPFYMIKVTARQSQSTILSINGKRKVLIKDVEKYITEKGFQLGESNFKKVKKGYVLKENESWAGNQTRKTKTTLVEEIITPGLCNSDRQRAILNALYYLDLVNELPEWPWPFLKHAQKKLELL